MHLFGSSIVTNIVCVLLLFGGIVLLSCLLFCKYKFITVSGVVMQCGDLSLKSDLSLADLDCDLPTYVDIVCGMCLPTEK